MNEIHKQWFIDMIGNEIEAAREAIQNERLWWLGSDASEEREIHRENILKYNNYIDVLNNIKNLVM